MKFELEPYRRNTPNEDLLNDLRDVAKKLGRNTVTMSQYSQHGRYHVSTLQRRFKSWPNALERAGLRQNRSPIGISDEELFQNLRQVWESLGRQPRYNEVRSPLSRSSSGTYENRFGSWRKSLEAFIDWVNKDAEAENTPDEEKIEAEAIVDETKSEDDTTPRSISLRLRFRVLSRDNFRCVACGRSPATHPGLALQVDHKHPWSRNGPTSLDNLQTLCFDCNQGKSNQVL